MSDSRRERDERRRREAIADLERIAEQSDVVGASAFRRSAERVRGHFLGEGGDNADWADIWGRRIGRVMSLLFLLALVGYLAAAYI